VAMKPKPFSPLNHFTVPCVIFLLLAGGGLPLCVGARPTQMPCPTRVLLIRAGSGVYLFLRAWMTRTPKPNDLNRYNYRPVIFVPSPRRRTRRRPVQTGVGAVGSLSAALRGLECDGVRGERAVIDREAYVGRANLVEADADRCDGRGGLRHSL
jgi:hypothetical protein